MSTPRTSFTGRYKLIGGSKTITVPGELVAALGLKHGDYIAIERVQDRFVCRKLSRDYVLGREAIDARALMRRESENELEGTRKNNTSPRR